MVINIRIPEHQDLKPRILVFGIGGAGGNAVNNMMLKNLEGAEFVAANTDAQALQQSNAQTKLQLGFCLLYTSPSPRDATLSRMPSSA